TGLTVADPLVTNLALASGDTDNDGKLDLTETWTYSGSYTVQQSDIDNGGVFNPNLKITNTASADSLQTVLESASASVNVLQNPHVTLNKTATVAGVTADTAGENITYTIAETNDVTMSVPNLPVTN